MATMAAMDRGLPGEIGGAWTRVRRNLKESASTRLFDQWLRPIELVETNDCDTVRLTLPSTLAANWVRNHYAERLLQEFRALMPQVRSVLIETRATAMPPVLRMAEPAVKPALAPGAGAPNGGANLDRKLSFDRFLVDPSNRVAFNAARALAEPGPARFTPLFFHAPTGLGKTHLMHAIGHAYLAQVPSARIVLLTADSFMFEFVGAIRANDTHAFKARLRAADLLLLDDIHFAAGKDKTQDELFHTINELASAGKRVVITADRCPQELDGIEQRIVGRLSMGLVAEVRPAGEQLRRALVEHRLAEQDGVDVPAAVIDLLVSRLTANLRELQGGLNRIIA